METRMLIEGNKYLVMKTRYEKRGMNWASGRVQEGGVYVSFTQKSYSDDFTISEFTPTDEGNFTICVKHLNRKSQKQIDRIANYIEENVDRLFGLWKDGMYRTILNILTAYGEKNENI